MTPTKRRVWVSRQEMDRVKEIIHDHLGQDSSGIIPFSAVVPALEKKELTRLIWCRAARKTFSLWGLTFGIRHRHQGYAVKVSDPQRWRDALAGLIPAETGESEQHEPAAPAETSFLSHLIPSIDPNYVMPPWAEHLRTVLQYGSKVLLTGPAGCGKTSIARQLAAQDQKPFLRINLNGETSVQDLLGSWKIQGQEMTFRYGPVAMAVQHGAVLCLDELDAALPAVLFALQGLLEDGGSLHIPDTNEWVKPHPAFRLVATANTVGKGDDTGLYAGTNTLNEAFLDRFHCVFKIDYLAEPDERQVVLGKVKAIEKRNLDRMLKVASDLRKALNDGLIYSSFSTRKLVAWACKTVQLGDVKLAAKYTVLNKLTTDDQRVVSEVLQRHGMGGI